MRSDGQLVGNVVAVVAKNLDDVVDSAPVTSEMPTEMRLAAGGATRIPVSV
jgi:hypothetical protein